MRKKYRKIGDNEKCTQAILFARVSSKRQKEEGVSLDVQMEAIILLELQHGSMKDM